MAGTAHNNKIGIAYPSFSPGMKTIEPSRLSLFGDEGNFPVSWNFPHAAITRQQWRERPMKRLLLIGFAACALALTPTISASAMPVAPPSSLGDTDGGIIQVKGGHGHHGHGHRGGHGHHYGWGRGHHHGHRHG